MSLRIFLAIACLTGASAISGCRRQAAETSAGTTPDENAPPVKTRFTLMAPEETGVTFNNLIREDYAINIFNFDYMYSMYNGGGVAAGDVNGDGWPDLYFSASLLPNRLYLNLGNFTFRDVTDLAGVGAVDGFKTGVAMADINGDGRLDIYACQTSKKEASLKTDYCYINMGNQLRDGINVPVFQEMNESLGIANSGNTNHCCFFDYDRDGDLDLLLVQHKLGAQQANKIRVMQLADGTTRRITEPETPQESNRLFRNDNGRFTDVTQKAGLVSSAYSLSATVADLNEDGWPDIFIANDYIEPDFLYINNKNGTFSDQVFSYLRHTTLHSMGCDIGDINNDGLADLATLEMRPEDPVRYKQLANMMQYDRYSLLIQHGYGPQVGWNTLQLNNGNGTFSEIGHYAGVSSTDWSWSVLMADVDQDGWKDMFVTNGYRKDITQLDYLNFFRDSVARTGTLTPKYYPDINDFLKFIPEQKLANYLFLNDGKLRFRNVARAAGLDQPSFSNGAALADLDRDGDLDLIVNNINAPAFLYRNEITEAHWLQIDPMSDTRNSDGIGALADVFAGGQHQSARLTLNRGFFSTSEPILHFGLGVHTLIDSVCLTWPDGKAEWLRNLPADQRLVWKRGTGKPGWPPAPEKPKRLFATPQSLAGWRHQEELFVDFKRERLIPYMCSAEGPCLATADLNRDGLTDIYAGNGAGHSSALFLQQSDGTFSRIAEDLFAADQHFEDCGAVFGDFDLDGDADLVVISGGNALAENDPGYMVREYRNDGKGGFARNSRFPVVRTNGGAIHAVDYDGDKDLDLLIGGRDTPGYFPRIPQSYLLRNDGGLFVDATEDVFPAFRRLGMITDIASADLDKDGLQEIIVAGEWMPLSIFTYRKGKFTPHPLGKPLAQTEGLWRSILVTDIDGDGDNDLVAGNHGLNHRLTASVARPLTLVAGDFDGNGSVDPITCFYARDRLYPYPGRDAMISQLPMLKKKFLRYNTFAAATIQEVLGEDIFEDADKYYVRTLRTVMYRLNGTTWEEVPLPEEVQWSPVMDILVTDVNHDGRKDLLMAGNFSYAEPETGEIDAGNGTLLLQQADGAFTYLPNRQHGFWAIGEVRELALLQIPGGRQAVLTGNNKGPAEITPLAH